MMVLNYFVIILGGGLVLANAVDNIVGTNNTVHQQQHHQQPNIVTTSILYSCSADKKAVTCDVDDQYEVREYFHNLAPDEQLEEFLLMGSLREFDGYDIFNGHKVVNFYMDTPELRTITVAAFQKQTYLSIKTFLMGDYHNSLLSPQHLFNLLNQFPNLETAKLNVHAHANLYPYQCRNQRLSKLILSFAKSISLFDIAFSANCPQLTYIEAFQAQIDHVFFGNDWNTGPPAPVTSSIWVNFNFCNLTSSSFTINQAPRRRYLIELDYNQIDDLRPFRLWFVSEMHQIRISLKGNPLDCEDKEHLRWIKQHLWSRRSDIDNAQCQDGRHLWQVLADPTHDDETHHDHVNDDIHDHITNITDTIVDNVPIDKVDDLVGLIDQIEGLIDKIANHTDQVNMTTVEAAVNLTSRSFNNVIESDKTWREMNSSQRTTSLSTMLRTNENVARLVNVKQQSEGRVIVLEDVATVANNNNSNNESMLDIRLSSFAFSSRLFTISADQHIEFDFGRVQVSLSLDSLPSEIVWLVGDNNNATVSASLAMMANMSSYLTEHDQATYNTPLISLVVGEHVHSINLTGPESLAVRFVHDHKSYFGERTRCVFWDFEDQAWSAEGCHFRRNRSNRFTTLCECDHLTSLTVLVDITNSERPSTSKSILTIVILVISIVFTSLALVLAFRYNKKTFTVNEDRSRSKKNRFWISINLMVWLMVSHLLILVGLDRTENEAVCESISIVLLFALLTTFTMMMMYSINLCWSTQNIFKTNFKVSHYLLVGYILPVIIIGFAILLVFLVETKSVFKAFIGEYFCWISSSEYPQNIWIFVAPMTLFILVNFGLFISILLKVFCRTDNAEVVVNKSAPTKQVDLRWLMVLILIFNFGIPWLLYVFYINEMLSFYFTYIFIIFNGSQGVTIFIDQFFAYRRRQKQRSHYRPSSSSGHKSKLSTKLTKSSVMTNSTDGQNTSAT